MKILPEVYIVSYLSGGKGLPHTPIGTHRSVEAAMAANEKYFGLKATDAIGYCKTGLIKHIAVLLTPGWYSDEITK